MAVKKDDKVLIGLTLFMFLVTLLVGIFLYKKKEKEEEQLLTGLNPNTNTNTSSKTVSYSNNTSIQKDKPISAADKETVKYVQAEINKVLEALRPIASFAGLTIPDNLSVDGIFGANTKEVLDTLFENLTGTKNASTKTLKELQAIAQAEKAKLASENQDQSPIDVLLKIFV